MRQVTVRRTDLRNRISGAAVQGHALVSRPVVPAPQLTVEFGAVEQKQIFLHPDLHHAALFGFAALTPLRMKDRLGRVDAKPSLHDLVEPVRADESAHFFGPRGSARVDSS